MGGLPAYGVRAFAAAIGLILVGALVAAVGGDRVWMEATGLALAGIGAVLGVSTAFYVIGRSEDEERERGER